MAFPGWSRRILVVVLATAFFVSLHSCFAFTRNVFFAISNKSGKRIAYSPACIVSLYTTGKPTIGNLSTQTMSTEVWGGEYAKDARIAARLVSDAVKLCMEYQQKSKQQELKRPSLAATTLEKTDGTPVTALDYAIQGYIFSSLKKHEEDGCLANNHRVSFVGEEDAKDLRDARQQSLSSMALDLVRSLDQNLMMENFLDALDNHGRGIDSNVKDNEHQHHRSWVLDPIDGTGGLLQGKQYCIGLALCIDGNAVVGVLGNPSASAKTASSGVMVAVQRHGLRYYDREKDMFLDIPRDIPNSWHTKDYDFTHLNDSSSSSFSSKTSNKPKQAGIDYPPFLLSMGPKTKASEKGSISEEQRQPPAPFGPLCNPTDLCCGSLVKYFAVASGQVAGFVQFSPASSGRVNSWDHAPGMLCVQESGGSVVVVGAEESTNRKDDTLTSAISNSSSSIRSTKPKRLPLFDKPQFYIHDGMACFAKEANAVIRNEIVSSVRRKL